MQMWPQALACGYTLNTRSLRDDLPAIHDAAILHDQRLLCNATVGHTCVGIA